MPFPTITDWDTSSDQLDGSDGNLISHFDMHNNANEACRQLDARTALPTAPSFDAQVDVTIDSEISSETVTLTGGTNRVHAMLVRGEGVPSISINSGDWLNFGLARNSDTIQLKMRSSASSETERIAELYIDGLSVVEWSVTTEAVLWDPTYLGSAVIAWLDADAITGLANNDPVSTWVNSIGSNDFTGSGAARPQYKTNLLDSKPVVRFSSSQLMTSASSIANWANKRGCVVGVLYPTLSGFGQVIGTYNGASSPRWIWYSTTAGSAYLYHDNVSTPTASNLDSGSTWVIKSFHRTGDTAAGHYRDGVLEDNITIANNQPADNYLYLGANSTGGQAWGGDIAELVLVSDTVSDSDRQKLEGYLAWKWGLEGNLDGSHPYASAPPTV